MELVECPIPETPEILIKVFGKKKLDDFLSVLFENVYVNIHKKILQQTPNIYFSQQKLTSYLVERNLSICLTNYYRIESQRLESLLEKRNVSPEELGKTARMAEIRLI